jgi:hypothetical protein
MRTGYKFLIVILFLSLIGGFFLYTRISEPTVYVNIDTTTLDFVMNTHIYEDTADELVKNRPPWWVGDIEINETPKRDIRLNVTADSWEDLQTRRYEESYPLINFGNATVQIVNSSVRHRLTSPERTSPLADSSAPYSIEWSVTNTTLEPGEMADFWINMTFNAPCNFEITEVSVDYLCNGKVQTATLRMNSYLVKVVMKDNSP